jgi:hypothetical protein
MKSIDDSIEHSSTITISGFIREKALNDAAACAAVLITTEKSYMDK